MSGKLNITFCSFPDFGGNAKALYEYMVKRYQDNMNYTWIVYNEESVEKLKSKGINAILIGTDEFKEYIPKTNVFFTTQGNLDQDKRKAKGSVYIELWHGTGPKPGGFAQKNPSEEDVIGYGNISKIVDSFVVPSDFWKVVYGAVFKVEDTRIRTFGMPILDYFKNSDGKGNLSKILDLDVTKYKKIIMYMPTFKQGFNHNDISKISNNIFNFDKEYDEKKLEKFLKDNNYLLCIKKHPGEQAKLNFTDSEYIRKIDEEDLAKYDLSVNEIINAFDLLITDYSSIGTEFLYLDRPVLFAVGDIDEYVKNRGIIFGNFDFWSPGPKCQDIKSLMEEIKKLLEDDTYYKKERDEKRKLWFADGIDGGCDKICDYVFDGYQISKDVVIHKSEVYKLREENKRLNGIVEEQIGTIKKLTESDIRLKEIENSRTWKLLEKYRYIRDRKIRRIK